jgi:hypothetical protein
MIYLKTANKALQPTPKAFVRRGRHSDQDGQAEQARWPLY